MEPALELRGIAAGYGPVQVLFGVDLVVPVGPPVALLGTNGAGKSTVLRVAAGLLRPSAGSVSVHGTDVTSWPAERRVADGLGLVIGGRATFPTLTLRENLALGGWGRLPAGGAEEAARLEALLDLFPSLRDRLDVPAGRLSGGEQQMAALARAMVVEPRVLLIDELSLGLAPNVVGQVVAAVEAIAGRGVTVVLVEQSLNIARAVCRAASFMEKGEVRFAGPIDELAERGDLARAVFFGRGDGPPEPPPQPSPPQPAGARVGRTGAAPRRAVGPDGRRVPLRVSRPSPRSGR